MKSIINNISFRRARHQSGSTILHFGKELTDRGTFRRNALLLSLAGQFNEPTAVFIMKWLVDTTIITGSSEKEAWDWVGSKLDDEKVRRKIVGGVI